MVKFAMFLSIFKNILGFENAKSIDRRIQFLIFENDLDEFENAHLKE